MISNQDEQLAIELIPDEDEDAGTRTGKYPFVADDDANLRCFVFESMCNSDLDARTMIKNMQLCVNWIKEGKLPKKQTHNSTAKVLSLSDNLE